ncbi:MAG TPA: hypothetical protein VK945_02240 [Planococcus sp. (in: firmicutes)]|nr:hypothetical protein [Planococcus sp. (in: firmicutes)]
MQWNKNRNVLLVAGIDCKSEQLLHHTFNISPENMLVLNSLRPAVLQPYGNLMRDIVIAVYQNEVEEIFIIGESESENEKATSPEGPVKILDKIMERGKTAPNIQALDYLFTYYMADGFSSPLLLKPQFNWATTSIKPNFSIR